MRKLSEVVNDLKREINAKWPDWNLIRQLAEEAGFVEDNQYDGYDHAARRRDDLRPRQEHDDRGDQP